MNDRQCISKIFFQRKLTESSKISSLPFAQEDEKFWQKSHLAGRVLLYERKHKNTQEVKTRKQRRNTKRIT